jgi:hypothetical protein
MKRIILLALGLIMFVGIAYADQFQFLYKHGTQTDNVMNSNIRVYDGHKWLFNGYTDKYGRTTINLSNGHYTCRVFYLNKWWKATLIIDGRKELKWIYIQQ